MKQVFVVLFSLFVLVSCDNVTVSGNLVTETRAVGNFDAISVGGAFEVEVKTGPVAAVVVEADDNIIKYIETTVSGNTLKIRTEGLDSYSDVHMKVYITTPSLSSIHASASAEVAVTDILNNDKKITFKANSSAGIKAEVNTPEVETDASSSATITLSGKTKTHKAEASSSAEIESFDLLSENTSANVSSSGTIRVHASVSLDAKASSSGSVEYKGAAAVTKSENSSGSVEKRD